MRQVFISYNREQIELARKLETKIKAADFDIWMDQDILVGSEWRDTIDDEISVSIALIVIMTPEAKASEYVTYEWSFAYGAGVRVIPIIYFDHLDLHPRLQTQQYVAHDDPQLWEKLINCLKDAQSSFITIHQAIWGEKLKMQNVTNILQEEVSSGLVEPQAHGNLLGDPFRGTRKNLAVVYSYGGRIVSKILEEYEYLFGKNSGA